MKDHEIGLAAINVIETLAEFTLCEKMADDGKITKEDYKKYLNDLPETKLKIINLFQEKQFKLIEVIQSRQNEKP